MSIFKVLWMIYWYIEYQDSETRDNKKFTVCFMWYDTKVSNQKTLLHSIFDFQMNILIYYWVENEQVFRKCTVPLQRHKTNAKATWGDNLKI